MPATISFEKKVFFFKARQKYLRQTYTESMKIWDLSTKCMIIMNLNRNSSSEVPYTHTNPMASFCDY